MALQVGALMDDGRLDVRRQRCAAMESGYARTAFWALWGDRRPTIARAPAGMAALLTHAAALANGRSVPSICMIVTGRRHESSSRPLTVFGTWNDRNLAKRRINLTASRVFPQVAVEGKKDLSIRGFSNVVWTFQPNARTLESATNKARRNQWSYDGPNRCMGRRRASMRLFNMAGRMLFLRHRPRQRQSSQVSCCTDRQPDVCNAEQVAAMSFGGGGSAWARR